MNKINVKWDGIPQDQDIDVLSQTEVLALQSRLYALLQNLREETDNHDYHDECQCDLIHIYMKEVKDKLDKVTNLLW